MTDNVTGQDEYADDDERRQPEGNTEEARDPTDEAEPVHDDPGRRLGEFDEALATHDYPTTTHELVEAYGDYEVETRGGWRSVGEVLAPIDEETYDSPDAVRTRIQGLLRR